MNISSQFTEKEKQSFKHIFANPVNDFIDGQQDCKDGKPAKKGASKDYERGYGFQYEVEARQGVNYEHK